MPNKMRNDDWERLFGPNVQRRGGPLQALGNILLLVIVLGVLTAGTIFLLRYRDQQQATAIANATTLAATVNPLATATRVAQTQTAAAVIAGQTAVAQPTSVAGIGTSTVVQGGNLRRDPSVSDTNIIGLIWPGDQVSLLEERDVSGQIWYRIQVLTPAPDRDGSGVAAGVEGWASSVLIAPVE